MCGIALAHQSSDFATVDVMPVIDAIKNSAPRFMDRLGKLCFTGHEVANYLFQVPDDESQWQRLSDIMDDILQEASKTRHKELPRIAEEVRTAMQQGTSMLVVEQVMSGFDRMIKIWKAARSGLF
jgi:hypothetical protein